MPIVRVTRDNVEKLARPRPKDGKARLDYFDNSKTAPRGFFVRVSESGERRYGVMYRTKTGTLRRYTLGRVGEVDLGKARDDAAAIKARARLGEDPQREKVEQRRAAKTLKAEGGDTLADLAKDYLEQQTPKLRPATAKDWERYLKKEILPKLGKRKASEVSAADVEALVERIRDGAGRRELPPEKEGEGPRVVWDRRPAPIAARHCLGTLSRVYNWAATRARWRKLIRESPCARIKPPAKAKVRDRVLTNDELRAVFTALPETTLGLLVGFLFRTATRVGETTSARWADMDLERGIWAVPGEKTKGGTKHEVPLAPGAVRILRKLKAASASEFVFPAPELRAGHHDKDTASRFVRELAATSGVEDWGAHDIRRTVSDRLRKELRCSPALVEFQILGHRPPKLMRTYMPSDPFEDARRALNAWDRHLDAILAGKAAAAEKVTRMQPRRRA